MKIISIKKWYKVLQKGGPGSGNFDHAGIPGQVGGSSSNVDGIFLPGEISSKVLEKAKNDINTWTGDRKNLANQAIKDANDANLIFCLSSGILKAIASIYEDKNTFYVSRLASAERGYGEKIMNKIFSFAKDNNRGVELHAIPEAEGFYRKIGMVESNYPREKGKFTLSASEIQNKSLSEELMALEPEDGIFCLPFNEKSIGLSSIFKGGAGSGNFDHAGRPGEVGGSGDGDTSDSITAPRFVAYESLVAGIRQPTNEELAKVKEDFTRIPEEIRKWNKNEELAVGVIVDKSRASVSWGNVVLLDENNLAPKSYSSINEHEMRHALISNQVINANGGQTKMAKDLRDTDFRLPIHVNFMYERNARSDTAFVDEFLTVLGDQDSVSFTQEQVNNMEYMVHNHPNSTSFSCNDIALFLSAPKMKRMDVVGKDGTLYSLEKTASEEVAAKAAQAKPVQGMTSSVCNAWNKIQDKTYEANLAKSGGEQWTSIADIWKEHTHEIAKEMAKEYGLTYTKKENAFKGKTFTVVKASVTQTSGDNVEDMIVLDDSSIAVCPYTDKLAGKLKKNIGLTSVFNLKLLKEMSKEDWIQAWKEDPHWDKEESSKLVDVLLNSYNRDSKLLNVLEIGCGNGVDSIAFGEKVKKVVGIDISPVAIKIAKKNNTLKNVYFQVGDAEKLDFKDEEFDLVYSMAVLHSSDLSKSIAEVARVLKLNGQALFFLYQKTVFDSKSREIEFKYAEIEKKLKDNKLDILKKDRGTSKDKDENGKHIHFWVVYILEKQ